MIPWTLLASSSIPGDGGEMHLYQRGSEYSIRVGSYELMNSRSHSSEESLASLVCTRFEDSKRVDILIGGLGMGFTLAAMLRDAGPLWRVTVSELVPAVVAWNRGPLADLAGRPLQDSRVTTIESDVSQLIRSAPETWDAIVLDVDNGPAGLTSKNNDQLYGHAGLRAAYAALRDGGILAVWSGGPDAAFTRRLQHTGFRWEEHAVRGRGKGGGFRYLIWIATK